MRRRGSAGLAALVAGLALSACGGGSGGGGDTTNTSTGTAPTVASTPATAPSVTETATAPATTPPTATTATKKPRTATSPESQPGGAGDETGIRVPATFIISGGRLTPPSIGVPAFLRIAFGVVNRDAKAHRVGFRGHTLTVPAHGSASITVTGLKKGHYPVTFDGRRRASIITGVQAGP